MHLRDYIPTPGQFAQVASAKTAETARQQATTHPQQRTHGTWWRRAQYAAYLYFGTVALIGLGFLYAAAINGEVLKALIGASVAWGSLGLGIGVHFLVRLASVVHDNEVTLSQLQGRADAAEALLQQLEGAVHQPQTLDGNRPPQPPAQALRQTTGSEPDAVATNGAAAGATGTAAATADEPKQEHDDWCAIASDHRAPGMTTDTEKPSMSLAQMRTAFRDAVIGQDFAQALVVGDDIVAHFPASAAAVQFRQLRPSLESKATPLHGAFAC